MNDVAPGGLPQRQLGLGRQISLSSSDYGQTRTRRTQIACQEYYRYSTRLWQRTVKEFWLCTHYAESCLSLMIGRVVHFG